MSRNAEMVRVARLADDQLLDLAVDNDVAATAELYHRYFHFAWGEVRSSHREADHSGIIAEAFRRTFEAARTTRIDFATALSAAIRSLTVAGPIPAPRRAQVRRRTGLGAYLLGAAALAYAA